MGAAIAIRNAASKRLFDVKVNEMGEILDYEVKTSRGTYNVSGQEVKKQIDEAKKIKEKAESQK